MANRESTLDPVGWPGQLAVRSAEPREVATELPYERRVHADDAWGMDEGDRHFRRDSELFRTLRRLARRLDGWGIDYAVIGGMAVFSHGYRRLTTDLDLLVTTEGFASIADNGPSCGYRRAADRRGEFRDELNGVKIRFHIAGTPAGPAEADPLPFPAPEAASIWIEEARYVDLPTLVELKLSSGVSPGRLKDRADVVELIQALELPGDFAEILDPRGRPKYRELWSGLQSSVRPDWLEVDPNTPRIAPLPSRRNWP